MGYMYRTDFWEGEAAMICKPGIPRLGACGGGVDGGRRTTIVLACLRQKDSRKVDAKRLFYRSCLLLQCLAHTGSPLKTVPRIESRQLSLWRDHTVHRASLIPGTTLIADSLIVLYKIREHMYHVQYSRVLCIIHSNMIWRIVLVFVPRMELQELATASGKRNTPRIRHYRV